MKRIEDTTEAWESGKLGRDAEHAQRLPDDEWKKERAELDEALGLKAISIRLEKELIEDFKMIAKINGMGYQPLMRQALKRFAECEKKRIITDLYNEKIEADLVVESTSATEEQKAA